MVRPFDCKLENDDNIGEVFQILGSGNGLVCIGREQDIFLLNPFSGESMKIPRQYLSQLGFDSFGGYGFGYDKAHNDYNVVAIVGDTGCFYSLRSTFWRLTEGDLMNRKVEYNIDRGVVLNGGIHWAVTFVGPGYDDDVRVIVVFDFESRRIWGDSYSG
ncbi:hypothetical protein Tsubulata_014604 [Turnera subulata]|uniref:F-box associated beta-propeller type 1 domain-containing protein n=1 Tax=Turnera subulata TaxID=218843 RepID=A0A9Q0G9J2_9ROSI|nr:hypothetical protein Tsubulata_014604 [Turnera subulata]